MKKKLQFLTLSIGILSGFGVKAQSYTESFDVFANLATSGWVFNNLSTPVGTVPNWIEGTATGPFPGFSNNYALANFNNVAGANTISNWMLTPVTNLENGATITFYTRTVDTPTFPDRLEVRMSTNGASTNVGTTNVSVGDFTTVLLDINPTLTTTGYPNTWTQYTATISGLGAPTSGRLAFRYFVIDGGPAGNNSDNIGVDEFAYTTLAGATADLNVTAVNREYTSIPLAQISAMALGGTIRNVGTAAATDAQLKVNVYLAPDFTTPVFTQTSAAAALATSTNSIIALGTYTPVSVGTYKYQYVSICSGNTVTSLDTISYDFDVTSNLYSRDNGIVSGALGIGSGAGTDAYLGNKFTITANTLMDSVQAVFNKSGLSLGDSTRVVIYNFAAGLPSAIVGTSAAYIFTAQDTLAGTDTKIFQIRNLTGGFLTLTPGDYLVSVAEYSQNVEIANSLNIFTTNTVFVDWSTIPGGTWRPVESFGAGFARTLLLRPYVSQCVPNSGIDTRIACGSLTWIDGITYTASNNTAQFTLTNARGCDSIVTLDLTIATVLTSTDVQASCGPYTWINGTTYTANNNTDQVTLTSVNGCDSIVTLNLTVNSASSSSMTQTACDSYTLNAQTYTTSGTFTQTLTNAAGCDSVITLNLTINASPNAVATVTPNNTINAAGGTSFQWYNCGTGQIIVGETGASFVPTANGSYAVIASNANSCANDTSACVAITTIGINEINTISALIFPNPTTEQVTVTFEGTSATLIIRDAQGKLIQSKVISNNELVTLSQVQSGIYFFELTTENGTSIQRVVKK